MSTYDYAKVMSDYANERMTVEMAMGHALQHIGLLYIADNNAATQQRELQAQIITLLEVVKTLRNELHQTLYAMRADMDRLINHTEMQISGQDKQNSSTKS